MKPFRAFAVGLMLATTSMHSLEVLAGQGDYKDGVIKLFEKSDGGGDSCSIPFKTGNYRLNSTSNCKNDQYTYFQLDNVPSATVINFNSENDCGEPELPESRGKPDWSYTLRTYIQPTTTAIIDIVNVSNSEVGSIVSKGVLLKKSYYSHGNIKGKLSCVNICRSGTTCRMPSY